MAKTSEIICLSSEDENDAIEQQNNSSPRKRKLSNSEKEPKTKKIRETQLVNDCSVKNSEKPLLIVKEIHPINTSNGGQDLFSMFLSHCLQRDRSEDMKKVVEKLKRRYEQLDPSYAQSVEFAELLNEKRQRLMNNDGFVYVHIEDVKEEMKIRKIGNDISKYMSCSSSSKSKQKHEIDDVEDEDPETIRRQRHRIELLEKTMKKCEKRIKELEEMEVNFDEEDNSSYLKLERYKNRMVDLHAKWCELTDNHRDAGRSYLRQKHFKLTGIVTVDEAINSFVNANIAKRRKKNENKIPILFPDYVDILKLIHAHNENKNLGMDAKEEKNIAKDAFTKLGGYLKLERQKDFYDTFSLMYENEKDPAENSHDLLEKLQENRVLGETKLNSVFEEYCRLQDEMRQASSVNVPAEAHKDSDNEIDDNDDDEDEDDNDDEANEKELSDVDINEMNVSDSAVNSDDESSNDTILIDDTHNKDPSSSLSKTARVIQESRDKIEENANNDKDNVNDCEIISNLPSSLRKLELEVSKKSKIEKEISRTVQDNELLIIKERKNNEPKKNDKHSQSASKLIENNNKVGVELGEKVVAVENAVPEKPLLKLRSFAKPSEFWKNSQESGQPGDYKQSEEKSIQVIDLEGPEDSKKSAEAARLCVYKTNKGVVVRKIVAIPATKILRHLPYTTRPLSKSNQSSKINARTGGTVVPDSTPNRPPPVTPVSLVHVSNAQTGRPIAHIAPQRMTLVKYPKNKLVGQGQQQIRVIPSTALAPHKTLKITPSPVPTVTPSISNTMYIPHTQSVSKVINPLAKRPNNHGQPSVICPIIDNSEHQGTKKATVNVGVHLTKSHEVSFKENEPGT